MIKRLILIFTVTIIVISIFGSLYLYNKLHSSIPQREGSIELNAIHAPVTIIFDQMGVPQVWASSSEDLWFALGWLHASDRLFQMDLTRKVAQGRLAEYFGSSVLEIDRSQRKIGHTYLADNAVDSLGGKAEQLLSGYAQGINSFVDTHDELPFEYLILGIEFEKWTVHDCLTLFSFQTWFSDALQNNDDLYNEILNCADPSATKHLLMGEPVWIPTTVPSIKTWYSLDDLKNEPG